MTTERNPSTAMAVALVDELARNGVVHGVVCPGSRSTALAIALSAHPDVTVHVRHDERSAAFVALGFGRATGRPAVVVTTSGTAVANLAPALAEAQAGGVPLVAMTADRPAELHGVGANQTLAQAGLFASLVRWQVDLPTPSGVDREPATWRSTVCRLVAAATGVGGGGPGLVGTGAAAGPVHCNVAFREPTVPGLDDGRSATPAYPHTVDGRADGAPWTRHLGTRPDLSGLVQRLHDVVADRRVLVVAGDSPSAMVGLDQLPWPVVAEPTAGGHAVPGIAHGSLLLGSRGWLAAHRPQVVVRLGHPTLSRDALTGLADVPTIQVNASGLVDPGRSAVSAFAADPAALVATLADDASSLAAPDGWRDEWVVASRHVADVVAGHLDGAAAPEPAVARRVVAAAGSSHLVVASSLPVRDVADFAAATTTGRVVANRGLSGIDGFTSTAVGVALATGPTVALAGDLSFLHDHNGLLVPEAAAVPLTLVVVDNDGGGLFHHVPAVRVPDFERLFAAPHGRDLVAIAAATGARALQLGIDEVGDFVAREGATAPQGLSVAVVHTDRVAGAAARDAVRREVADAVADLA